MLAPNLDMDVLRTLVVASDLGGFVHAAARLGRSQSAVSLQIKKLEDQLGQQIFRKNGRGVALTEAGDVLVSYARQILDLNDEAIFAARGSSIEGTVRLGVPHDFAGPWLSNLLARFRGDHPLVHIQLQVGRSRDLLNDIGRGSLDLAVALGGAEHVHARTELPIRWVGRRDLAPDRASPLALALLEPPCFFRQAAIEALEQEHRAWRPAATSPAVVGLWAAVRAGLGIAPRIAIGLPDDLVALDAAEHGLPSLPTIPLVLCAKATRLPIAAGRLRELLAAALGETAPIGKEWVQ